MKHFVYIALAVLLGTVVSQGYGPPFHRGPPHGPHHGPPHGPHHGPPHGPHHGPPHEPRHGPPHGPPHGPSHGPPHHGFGKDSDESPSWDSKSDSSDSCSDSCDSFSGEKHHTGSFDSSYEDSGDWHHNKDPCTKKPATTESTTPKPTTPKPTTQKPIPETTTDGGLATISPKIAKCIKSCPSKPEYNPVCGSDGKTYDNEGKLRCARTCGVDVTLQHRSACPKPTTPAPIPETTPTLPETTKTDGGLTTMSPKIAKCIKSCPSTPEYNPVCGSDGKTYDNEGKLRCARTCGVDVALQRRSPCSKSTTPNPIPETTTTLPEPTITDGGRMAKCIKSCPSTPEYNPVCGSDGKTYENEGKLFCAKSCGVDVALQRRSPCSKSTTPNPIPETTTTLPESTITDGGRMAKCIKSCPSTPEYNPVCGSDGKTYENEGKLFCAKSCGVDVALQRRSPCSKSTTPNPIPETTTTLPEPTITDGGRMAKCIKSCPSTPEYNPVCGSDGKTYENEGKLFCAKSCGVDVSLRRRSVCPPPTPGDGGSTQVTLPPTTTATTPHIGRTTPHMGRTTPSLDFTKCMSQCAITSSFTPVCGTDLVTYMNMDRLKCAQSCGQVVEVLCEKPCAACVSKPVTTTSKPKTSTLPPITTTQGGRTTPKHDLQECMRGCPVTSEYNPVCGSDQVTYSNPGRLLCAQMCGVDVAVSRSGPCGFKETTSTTTETPSTTLSPKILSCIKRCRITPENEPVCGTDNLTYSNLGSLYCSRFCGVDVDVKYKSRCVDGNKDRVTTPMPPTTPTSKVTTDPSPNTSTTSGFTLPQDVIDEIFGTTPTQAPTTKPYNPDEDEDLDLDVRYNEVKHTEGSS